MNDTQAAQPAGRGLVTEAIAVLGAGGTMGLPIARNIARAGLPVRAWSQTAGKAGPLADDGAYLARTPYDAARGAGIVITMLADEEAVVQAMDGPDGALRAMAAARGPRRAVWAQMSTIGEAATRRCAGLANQAGVGFVDAPVLGTRQPAEEGKLIVLESGPAEARPRLAPVFDAIGQRTIRAGEAGAGTRLKLVASSWVLAVVKAGAEAVALAEGLGLDPALFFQAIDGGPLDLPYLRMKARAAEERDLDLPLIEAIARRFGEAAKGHGDKDLSATYLMSAPNRN